MVSNLSGRVRPVAGAHPRSSHRCQGRPVGAVVYATGHSSRRLSAPSDMERGEASEETADLMAGCGSRV